MMDNDSLYNPDKLAGGELAHFADNSHNRTTLDYALLTGTGRSARSYLSTTSSPTTTPSPFDLPAAAS